MRLAPKVVTRACGSEERAVMKFDFRGQPVASEKFGCTVAFEISEDDEIRTGSTGRVNYSATW